MEQPKLEKDISKGLAAKLQAAKDKQDSIAALADLFNKKYDHFTNIHYHRSPVLSIYYQKIELNSRSCC
jgi:hypothetical protein